MEGHLHDRVALRAVAEAAEPLADGKQAAAEPAVEPHPRVGLKLVLDPHQDVLHDVQHLGALIGSELNISDVLNDITRTDQSS